MKLCIAILDNIDIKIFCTPDYNSITCKEGIFEWCDNSERITISVKINDKLKNIFKEMYDELSIYEINIQLKKLNDIYTDLNYYNVDTVSDKLKTTCSIHMQINKMISENYFNTINKLIELLLKDNLNILM